MRHDFLDEIVAERARRDPDFPALVEAAGRRRDLLSTLDTKLSTVERYAAALGYRVEYRLVPDE